MKVTDLMVGDWVTLHGKRRVRCENILGHTNDVMLENGVVTNVMNIEPIQLTDSILESCMGKKDDYGYYWLRTDFYDVDLYECSDSIWRIYCHYTDSTTPINHTAEISYVHEFQHFMRLCGIFDEIIKF